jgi:anti-anti-sigma factor
MKIMQDTLIGDVDRIAPQGRLDAVTVPALETLLKEHFDGGHAKIVIDLSEVTYMSSSGLRALLQARKQAGALGGDLVLCCMSPRVREVFEMIGFTSLFKVFDHAAEAATAFAKSVTT